MESLKENYNSQELADQLAELGDISYLDVSLERPERHTFKTLDRGYTIFYGRDRGDKNTGAFEFDDYERASRANLESYNYYWDGSNWYVDEELVTDTLIAQYEEELRNQ